MQTEVSRRNRGLLVTLALTVTRAPRPQALERDDAGARAQRILTEAAQRISDVLVVATQDVLRDEITAALLEQHLPVVRVEVQDIGSTLQARAFLAYPDGDERVVTDEQRADADAILSAYAAAHAAQE